MNDINGISNDNVSRLDDKNRVSNVHRPKKDLENRNFNSVGQSGDEVILSQEGLNSAQKAAEVARYAEMLNSLPEADAEKVREVKAKVARGEYFTRDVAVETARQLLNN